MMHARAQDCDMQAASWCRRMSLKQRLFASIPRFGLDWSKVQNEGTYAGSLKTYFEHAHVRVKSVIDP